MKKVMKDTFLKLMLSILKIYMNLYMNIYKIFVIIYRFYKIFVIIYCFYLKLKKLIRSKNLWLTCKIISKEYIIQIANINQVLNNGLVLKKMYKVIKFNKKNWLKSYIDINAVWIIQFLVKHRDMKFVTTKEEETI